MSVLDNYYTNNAHIPATSFMMIARVVLRGGVDNTRSIQSALRDSSSHFTAFKASLPCHRHTWQIYLLRHVFDQIDPKANLQTECVGTPQTFPLSPGEYS